MITESAKDILIVLYVPAGAIDASLEVAIKRIIERLTLFAGASVTRSGISRLG
jgi:DNA/RNA-binding domain of Phe-tRNA-synthetase-like protein